MDMATVQEKRTGDLEFSDSNNLNAIRATTSLQGSHNSSYTLSTLTASAHRTMMFQAAAGKRSSSSSHRGAFVQASGDNCQQLKPFMAKKSIRQKNPKNSGLPCDKRKKRNNYRLQWRLSARIRFLLNLLLITLYNDIPVAHSAKLATNQPNTGHSAGDHGLHSNCNHVYPKPHEIVHGAFIEPHHVMKKRSIDQPLRIILYYDESVHNLDKEKKELINNTVLPEAISYWEQALMVRRTERAILLNRRCPNQQVYYKADDPHPYCKVECEAKTMCGEVQVPAQHLDVCRVCNENGTNCRIAANSTAGPGIVDADFVFYVSALQTPRCKHGFTVAYAAHCQQESALDRPIAGHANLCPKSISTKPQELDTLISTVKHEILHALGFSVSLYAFYRDDHGNPLTPRDNKGKPPLNTEMQARQWSDRVIKKVTRTDWKVRDGNITRTMQMIVTPRVMREVRRHFDCPDLEGAELEDQGEEGTALTHWEKRIFENEAMTGTHTQNPVYSRITLALMEDTGWYKANYDMAQDLAWGDKLGCDFAKKSCMEWMITKKEKGEAPLPYCDRVKAEPLETQCTDDHSSVALCNLVRYTAELPREYQNFDKLPLTSDDNVTTFGGSVTLADYCPYVQEFTWRANSVVIRGSHCYYDENNPDPDKNFALEEYGQGSRCFYHTDEMWEERSCQQKRHWQHWGSGCYRYLCDGGLLHIVVTNRTFTCTFPGQELKIQLLANGWLHRGGIKCPACEDFCGDCGGQIENYELIRRNFPVDNLKCSSGNYLVPIFTLLPTTFMLTYTLRY